MDVGYRLSNMTDGSTVNESECYDYGKDLEEMLYQMPDGGNHSRTMYIFNNYSSYRLYQRTKYHLYFHFYPVLYVIGVPGNVLSAVLWLHPLLRTTTGVYFSILAITDTLVLFFHLKFVVESAFTIEIIRSNTACKVFNSLFTASDCLSVVLVLAITVERFVVVCYPMHRKRLCSMRRTMTVLCLLLVFAGIIGIIEGVLWNYDVQLRSCTTRRERMRTKRAIELSNLLIVSVAFFGPIVVLLVLDVMIIVRIRKSRLFRMEFVSRRSAATPERKAILKKQSDKENSYILLVLSFYVALSKTPESVCYFISAYFLPVACLDPGSEAGHHAWDRYFQFLLISATFQAFSLTNYAINCWVYSLLGRKFRATIRTLLCGKKNVRFSSLT